MSKQKDFETFLSNIEPSESTVQYIKSVHTNLREYLRMHSTYKQVYKDSFLSGSYAKHTSIRPVKGEDKRDVDIVIVTTYTDSVSSAEVLEELCETLKQSKKYESAQIQHHSVGIEMGQISVDVVPVISDMTDEDLFYIGDSREGNWTLTDPKGHKSWSSMVNQENDGKYKPLVKIFKWWRRNNCPAEAKYPKGIALEKIISDNLGDFAASTEDFLIETMENIVTTYKELYVDKEIVPVLDDPSDKVENNLLEGYTPEDFGGFIRKIEDNLQLLNDEEIGNETWRKVLGTEFPGGVVSKNEGKKKCSLASHRQRMPWPVSRGGAVFIVMTVKDKNGCPLVYEDDGYPLEKGCSLTFRAITAVKYPDCIMWQVTNTGEEAKAADCLRGDFEPSDYRNIKYEGTEFSGSHSIQCFVIKKGVCVAKSKDYIINVA